VLDEPTTGLDVLTQDRILTELMRLRSEEGMAMVYVSHDLAVVARMADRIAVMYAGRVVETGTVDEVFREPRHPYTLGLLRSVPDVDGVRERLSSIPGVPPDAAALPDGCPFHPRCPFAIAECTHGEFPLRSLGGGRATACIRDDVCAEEARRDPVVAHA